MIDQWISELSKIADKKAFKIVNYYGNDRRHFVKKDFENCDVVLSTIDTFSKIMGGTQRKWDDYNHEWWQQAPKRQLIAKLPEGFFSRIVVDEAHDIRNGVRCQVITSFASRQNIQHHL